MDQEGKLGPIKPWEERLAVRRYTFTLVDPDPNSDSSGTIRFAAITERLAAACAEEPGPFSSSQIAQLTMQLNRGSDLLSRLQTASFQSHLVGLLKANEFQKAILACLSPTTTDNHDRSVSLSVLQSLHKHWNTTYYGRSLVALKERLLFEERSWCMTPFDSASIYYAKSFPIIQSSGTGKSRLIDELGKTTFCIGFTLRLPGQTGYPPGDREITQYLNRQGKSEYHVSQVLAAGVLAGAFKEASAWCMQNQGYSYEVLCDLWRSKLAPRAYDPKLDSVGLGIPETRSKFRQSFCQKVLEIAKTVGQRLVKDEQWINRDSDKELERIPLYQAEILGRAQSLVAFLKQLSGSTAVEDRMVVLYFDEAASLVPNDNVQQYTGLRRVLRSLNSLPIWTLFLSTHSMTKLFAAPKASDPSARIRVGSLKKITPFTALELDIEASRHLEDQPSALRELTKPLAEFTSTRHMAMFGRPLWQIFQDGDYTGIRDMALFKLLNGQSIYYPENTNHVFAFLAARLSLDPCLDTTEATSLASEAVHSHLRIALAINAETGVLSTTTPSEPIVSEAAASYLMRRSTTWAPEFNWTSSITTLTGMLLSRGLVHKGLKGELYARLLLVLARDFLLLDRDTPMCQWSQPFTVVDYLENLFHTNWHEQIFNYRMENPRSTRSVRQDEDMQSLRDTFKSGIMNFNHFTHTDRSLSPTSTRDLLHNLMRQHAALQLSFTQESWDLLIPVYFGSPTEQFNPQHLSALVIQIKNKSRTTPMGLNPKWSNYFGGGSNPILCLLLDFGYSSPEVNIQSVRGQQHVFGIHAVGRGGNIYRPLQITPGLEAACMGLFRHVNHGGTLEDEINKQNVRFGKHSWQQRFPNMYPLSDSEDKMIED